VVSELGAFNLTVYAALKPFVNGKPNIAVAFVGR
jgi:hypothetical protein